MIFLKIPDIGRHDSSPKEDEEFKEQTVLEIDKVPLGIDSIFHEVEGEMLDKNSKNHYFSMNW